MFRPGAGSYYGYCQYTGGGECNFPSWWTEEYKDCDGPYYAGYNLVPGYEWTAYGGQCSTEVCGCLDSTNAQPPLDDPFGPACSLCGNGVSNNGEECEDGNTVSGDGCSATCTTESCGNGTVEGSEQCDGNTGCTDPLVCDENCKCVSASSSAESAQSSFQSTSDDDQGTVPDSPDSSQDSSQASSVESSSASSQDSSQSSSSSRSQQCTSNYAEVTFDGDSSEGTKHLRTGYEEGTYIIEVYSPENQTDAAYAGYTWHNDLTANNQGQVQGANFWIVKNEPIEWGTNTNPTDSWMGGDRVINAEDEIRADAVDNATYAENQKKAADLARYAFTTMDLSPTDYLIFIVDELINSSYFTGFENNSGKLVVRICKEPEKNASDSSASSVVSASSSINSSSLSSSGSSSLASSSRSSSSVTSSSSNTSASLSASLSSTLSTSATSSASAVSNASSSSIFGSSYASAFGSASSQFVVVNSYCGDGRVDAGEQCDDGVYNANSVADTCRTTCRLPRCGDGVVDTGEYCDDGNANDGDSCSSSCRGLLTCDDDNDCPLQMVCDNGYCQGSCEDDSDCSAGQRCIENMCVDSCDDDADCPFGLVCEDGLCANDCDDDDECSTGQRCIDNMCVDFCEDDGDCPAREQCINNVCVASCTDSSDCPSGWACINNQCREACGDDADCSEGLICVDGYCSDLCDDGNDCPLGLACVDGQCTDACESDDQCAFGWACINNQCREACGDDADCSEGLICVDGYCSDLCDDGNDCAAGYACVDGRCGKYCESDGECAFGYICANNACVEDDLCGDGTVQEWEQCDQGPANNNRIPNRCRENCMVAYLGDGVVDNGEECDDGNTVDGDGCDSDGRTEGIAGTTALASANGAANGGAIGGSISGTSGGSMNSTATLPAALLSPPLAASFINIDGRIDRGHAGAPFSNPETGPAAVLLMASGAAGGLAWMRRGRRG